MKAGAEVTACNDTGDTPLHKEVLHGFTECVDVLLKAGANVNVQNNTGNTPLHKQMDEDGELQSVWMCY